MGMLGHGIRISRQVIDDKEFFQVLFEKPEDEQKSGYMWNDSGLITAEQFTETIVRGGGTEADAAATLEECRRFYAAKQ